MGFSSHQRRYAREAPRMLTHGFIPSNLESNELDTLSGERTSTTRVQFYSFGLI